MKHECSEDATEHFHLSDLDYDLPESLIAQAPPKRRQDARLLVIDRNNGALRDTRITDLPQLLAPGDLVILNDTRVTPARFFARRKTGGRVEGLFLEETTAKRWRVMLKGSRKVREGETILAGDASGEPVPLRLIANLGDGLWEVAVESDESPESILDRIGQTPLPPYIKRNAGDQRDGDDRERYQTVFAAKPGAVAAPTAGLHLTRSLIGELIERDIETARITLHVGVGTFRPITAGRIDEHTMHTERFELSEDTAAAVKRCRARGGRGIAVGTTCGRVLESTIAEGVSRTVSPRRGATDIFIYPPRRFGVVDVLLTNFHLPRSTLLALVMAFAGVDLTRRAYAHAIDSQYRFYSFGDAMLIL